MGYFVKLITALLIFCTLSWGFLKIWGENQQYGSYEHEFFKIPKATSIPAPFVESPEQIQQWKKQNPVSIVVIKVEFTKDEKIKDLKGNDLTDYLKIPNTRFILWTESNVLGVQLGLVKILDDNPKALILIASPYEVILTSTREQRPLAVFGSSQSDWMRWLSFDSIGLIGIAPFKSDALIMPLEYKKRKLNSESFRSELTKRKKLFILGPVKTKTEFEHAKTESPDAILIPSLGF